MTKHLTLLGHRTTRIFPILLFIGLAWGQDEILWFLESDKNLKYLDNNYEIIQSELDNMLLKYKESVLLKNPVKINYKEEIIKGSYFDEDAYLSALMQMNNPSQAEANAMKNMFYRTVSENINKEKNRQINLNDTLLFKDAEWNELVSHYGGYSQLSEKSITKDKIKDFNVSVVLETVELIGKEKCLAYIKIFGSDKALKFHNIPKRTFKYEGNYKITFADGFLPLYVDNSVWYELKFDEKKYLPKSKTKLKFFLNKNSLPDITLYKKTIKTMFNDLVPNRLDIFFDNSSDYVDFKTKYRQAFGKKQLNRDIQNGMNLNEIKLKFESYVKKKELKAKKRNDKIKEVCFIACNAGCWTYLLLILGGYL